MKQSDGVQYTRGGNPKPTPDAVVQGWVRDSWNGGSIQNIKHSILSAGFNEEYEQWHISKHDVYGARFLQAWINTGGETEAAVEMFDDVEYVILDDEAQ